MATKSVIEIDVNDDRFKAFVNFYKQFEKAVEQHQKKIKNLENGWGAIGTSLKKTVGVVDDFTAKVQKIGKEFNAASGATQKMVVGLKAADRTVTSIAKTSASIAGNIASATMNLAKWGAFGLIGGLLGGAGGLFGLTSLAGSASQMRRQSLGLGLSSGELQAAKLYFQKYGDVESLLGNIAGAKADITKWGAFTPFGLNPTAPTGQLMPQILKKAMGIAKGTPEGLWNPTLSSTGLSEFGIDTETLRRLRDMKEEELDQDIRLNEQRSKQINLDDDTLKAWTNFKIQLDTAATAIEDKFIKKLTSLTGPLSSLSESFEHAVDVFLESNAFKDAITWLTGKIKDFAEYMKTDEFKKDFDNFLDNVEKMSKALMYLADFIIKWLGPKEVPKPDQWGGEARDKQSPEEFLKNVEKSRNLPSGILDKIWGIESSRRVTGVPDSPAGAQGPFQMKKNIQNAYGVTDPQNIYQEGEAAGKFLQYLLKKYNGDVDKAVAAYNQGETRIDAASLMWGPQWREHIADEGKNFLKKFHESEPVGGSNQPAQARPASYGMPSAYDRTNFTVRVETNTFPGIDTNTSVLYGGGYFSPVGVAA